MSTAADSDDRKATVGWVIRYLGRVLPFVLHTKAEMLAADLREHQCACPECGGRVYFSLLGRKDHLRVACINWDCPVRMME